MYIHEEVSHQSTCICCIYLTEESSNKGLPDVDVIVSAGELGAGATQREAVHDTRQLFTHTIRQLH